MFGKLILAMSICWASDHNVDMTPTTTEVDIISFNHFYSKTDGSLMMEQVILWEFDYTYINIVDWGLKKDCSSVSKLPNGKYMIQMHKKRSGGVIKTWIVLADQVRETHTWFDPEREARDWQITERKLLKGKDRIKGVFKHDQFR